MKPIDQLCPRCGAAPGAPCRSVGRLRREGDALATFHAARRREAKDAEDKEILAWERWELRRGLRSF